jgi:hypothetical protein
MNVDVVILQIPRIAPVRPSSGTATVKAMCNRAGISSRLLDINREFFMEFVHQQGDAAREIDDYWIQFNLELSATARELYHVWQDQWIQRILDLQPRLVAISVFSWQSQRFCQDFCERLRPRFSGEILLGGQGLSLHQHISSHQTPSSFARQLRDQGIVDWWLKGETEETFPRFLAGERELPGLNNDDAVFMSSFSRHVYPDFSDTVHMQYQNGYEGGVLPLETSRGCVRACAFCDQSTEFGAHRDRTGQEIFNELLHHHQQHGVRHFYFHDYVINGNNDAIRDFCNLMIAHYRQNNLPDRYFQFSGYWIVRNPNQWNAQAFDLLWRAGVNTLITGVETGSDRLRKTLMKGFTNRDLDFYLEQIDRLGIRLYFMLIAGLPGETPEDFQNTLDMLTRWQPYVARGRIIGVNLGTTPTVEPGTYWERNPQKFGLVGLKGGRPDGINWMSTLTPELDYRERARRRVALQEHVMDLGYPMWKGDDHLKIMVDAYKTHVELWSD